MNTQSTQLLKIQYVNFVILVYSLCSLWLKTTFNTSSECLWKKVREKVY